MRRKPKIPKCSFLDGDRAIVDASNSYRSAINWYRNAEGATFNTFHMHTPDYSDEEIKKLLKKHPCPIDERPIPKILSCMAENIAIYLNRSMQHLSKLMYDKLPHPNSRDEMNTFYEMARSFEPLRKDDILLFASNAFIQIDNLDASLFKQAAGTLYNKYTKETDRLKIKIPSLKERLATDYVAIHDALFNNGLQDQRQTLKGLRNTASHSDLGSKIEYGVFGNPYVWVGNERKDLYTVLQGLSLAYLKKGTKFYRTLAEETMAQNKDLDVRVKGYVQNQMHK